MKILVTVKRVEDPESKIKLNADNSDIVKDGLSYVINPFDEIALEEAVRLKKPHGAEVVVLSLGSKDATQQLRTGLAIGADRAILVEVGDEVLDSDCVAHIFKAVVDKESPDLILMGKQAIDDDCNQTGQLLAEYLGWPQITYGSKKESLESAEEKGKKPAILIDGDKVTAVREIDGGLETVETSLPALMTVDLRLNVPRYPALPNIIKAKRKPFETLSISDLGVDVTPKVTVLGYEPLPERQAGVRVADVDELLDKLQNEAKVL